jgi:prepilin-type processing-associated H-X9-DG protein
MDHGTVRTSGKAVASLVLGIASLLCTFFTGIPAVIMGLLGLRDIGRAQGCIQGKGLAIAGIVTGGIGTMFACPAIVIALLIHAVHKEHDADLQLQCLNNLEHIALALHSYHSVYGRFPPAVVRDHTGKPLYSWRVLLLEFLDEPQLHRDFHLDEAWDSPHNKTLLGRMPGVFAHPDSDESTTLYQALTGPGTAFEDPEGQTLATFTDGPERTLVVVEGAQSVPWTEPVDLTFDPKGPLPQFGNLHAGGFNAAFADGSVRFLEANCSERTLRALITRNGGEQIELEEP